MEKNLEKPQLVRRSIRLKNNKQTDTDSSESEKRYKYYGEVDDENELEDEEVGEIEDEPVTSAKRKSNKLYPDLTDEMKRGKQAHDQPKRNKNISKQFESSDNKQKRFLQKKDKISVGSKESSSWIENNCYYFLFAAIFIGALAFSYYRFRVNETQIRTENINSWDYFSREFDKFKTDYKGVLPVNGTKVLFKAVERVMNTNRSSSSSPAVILFVGSSEQNSLLNCITDDFVKIIADSYKEQVPVIDGSRADKQEVDRVFKETFEIERKHIISVKNLEQFPAAEMMTFHQFTDHENAKYTDAIIVLAASSKTRISLKNNARFTEMDQVARSLLEELMNDWKEDQREPLISRFTPSVVAVLYDNLNLIKCK